MNPETEVIYGQTLNNVAVFYGEDPEALFPRVIVESGSFKTLLSLEVTERAEYLEQNSDLNPFFKLILVTEKLIADGWVDLEQIRSSEDDEAIIASEYAFSCLADVHNLLLFINQEEDLTNLDWQNVPQIARATGINIVTIRSLVNNFLRKLEDFGLHRRLFTFTELRGSKMRVVSYSPVIVSEVRRRIEEISNLTARMQRLEQAGKAFPLQRLAAQFGGSSPYYEFGRMLEVCPGIEGQCVPIPPLSNPYNDKPVTIYVPRHLYDRLRTRLAMRRRLPEKGDNVEYEFSARDLRGGRELEEAFRASFPDLSECEIEILTCRVSWYVIKRIIGEMLREAYPRRYGDNSSPRARCHELADFIEMNTRKGRAGTSTTTLYTIDMAYEIRRRIVEKILGFPEISEVEKQTGKTWYTYSDIIHGEIPDLLRSSGRVNRYRLLKLILTELGKIKRGFCIEARSSGNRVALYYSYEAVRITAQAYQLLQGKIAVTRKGDLTWIQLNGREDGGNDDPMKFLRKCLNDLINEGVLEPIEI